MKILLLLSFISLSAFASPTTYQGSRFSDVWQQITSDVYTQIPNEEVSLGKFFDFGKDLLARAAVRTVTNQSDLLPRFNKLLHPNGVCLMGIWKIQKASKYSGFFKIGSEGLIISRASVALTETEKGHYRGFGLAGKIFPTVNPSDKKLYKTANFFTIDDLSGTKADSFLDTELANQPKVSLRFGSIFSADVATAAALALGKADANPLKRQVYQIAQLGLQTGEALGVPSLMKLSGSKGQARSGVADFREELLSQIIEKGFVDFDISVADTSKVFNKIGTIRYTEAVASDSCDHRLHFHHAKFLRELD